MKKIIILVVSLFIISGCTATYNLDIDSLSNINEELVINDSSVTKEEAETMFPELLTDYSVIVDDDDLTTVDSSIPRYDRKVEEVNGVSKITYNYKGFKYSSFTKSNIARAGFKNIGFVNNSGTAQLSTSNVLKAFDEYPDLNSLTVNIKSGFVVLENNADSVSNNIYTWNFTRENKDKNIVLLLDTVNRVDSKKENNDTEEEKKEEKDTSRDNEEKKSSILTILLYFLGFIVVIFVLFGINNRRK